ncbi:MAG: glycine betaine/L-proline ABC transporter ATP-binding protein [Aerococcus sp.]|nr:glycine betaine/L-proline ABC transporter ATP-binding protein [Aerococcus sp.]
MANIAIKNLSKIYGKPDQIREAKQLVDQNKSKEEIVDKTGATVGVYNASFEIKEGETFVIMGLSGSGKSTILRMINRLIEPTSGDVYIDNVNVTKASDEELREVRRKKVSMVFQSFALFPHKTILENTEYGLEIQGVDKAEREKRAKDALENSGLGPYINQYPNQLSGGMQQRVGLARALANDPEILLMDEAFSALDPLIRTEMQDELLRLQEELGKTIVFITHDLDEALRLGDRIALMRNGHVVQIGTGEDILENPENDYVERFVENVDRSKVFTAEHAMSTPRGLINMERTGARMTLRIMQDMNMPSIPVVDDQRVLKGYVTDSDVAKYLAHHRHEHRLKIDSLLRHDLPIVKVDTPLNDVVDVMTKTNMVVAVVDDDNKLQGYVNRRMVISELASEDDEGLTDEEAMNLATSGDEQYSQDLGLTDQTADQEKYRPTTTTANDKNDKKEGHAK